MTIPFTVVNRTDTLPEGAVIKVTISAPDGSPLPEKTELETDVSGEYEFGPIVFSEPGDHLYIIKEDVQGDNEIVPDESVYYVKALVIWDDEGGLTGGYSVLKKGQDLKPNVLGFENDTEYVFDDSGGTGDDNDSYDNMSYDSISDDNMSSDSASSDSRYEPTDSGGTSHEGISSQKGDTASSGGLSSWGDLLVPDTGSKVTLGTSGLMLAGLAHILIGRRRGDDRPHDDETG